MWFSLQRGTAHRGLSVFGTDSVTLSDDRAEVHLIASEGIHRASMYASSRGGRVGRTRVPGGAPGGTGGQFTGRMNSAPEVSL